MAKDSFKGISVSLCKRCYNRHKNGSKYFEQRVLWSTEFCLSPVSASLNSFLTESVFSLAQKLILCWVTYRITMQKTAADDKSLDVFILCYCCDIQYVISWIWYQRVRDHSTCTDSPKALSHSSVSAWELEVLPQHQQQLHHKHYKSYTNLWEKATLN